MVINEHRDHYAWIVVFHKGKRLSERVNARKPKKLRKAAAKVARLRKKGFRANLVYRTSASNYPPVEEIEPKRDEGYWWCPYCRAWRFFSIPRWRPNVVLKPGPDGVIADDFYMNSCANQQIRLCQWCLISENDWWVKKSNRLWGEEGTTKRRRRRRVRR